MNLSRILLKAQRNVQILSGLVLIVGGLLFWRAGQERAPIPPVDQLHTAASVAGYLLLIAAAAGIAAMATVQFWKVLFRPRSAFHASELESLFGEHLAQVLGLSAPASEDSPDVSEKPEALDHLLDNPTEIVMGQLRSTADYILLRPQGFKEALELLAGPAGKAALRKYWAGKREPSSNMPNESSSSSIGRSDEALVEVRFFVEQHLNLIHVRMKERWRWRVRVVAVIVAGSAALLSVALSDLEWQAKVSAVFAALIWGGFFSWLARDLVALVERRRV